MQIVVRVLDGQESRIHNSVVIEAGVTKAGDNTPDSSTEISGSKRIRNESTGEGAMAARLATKIKHALEVGTHVKPSQVIFLWGNVIFRFYLCNTKPKFGSWDLNTRF